MNIADDRLTWHQIDEGGAVSAGAYFEWYPGELQVIASEAMPGMSRVVVLGLGISRALVKQRPTDRSSQ